MPRYTFGQILNRLLISTMPLKQKARASPTELTVDVTTMCNFNCAYCSTRSYMKKLGPKNMSFEFFRQLLKLFTCTDGVSLSGSGEPLLNPELCVMVKHARKNHRVFVTSNGSLSFEKYEELLETPPRVLEISLKGVSPEEFSLVTGRDSALFYSVIDNVKQIVRKRRNNRAPRIVLSYMCDKLRVRNVPQVAAIAADCNVDELWLDNLIPDATRADERNCLYSEDEKELEETLERVRKKAPKLKIRPPRLYSRKNTKHGCRMPFTTLRIGVDGGVSGCARAIPASLDYGNAFTDRDVFNSPHFRELRRSFLEVNVPLRYECRYCSGCQ